MMPRHALRGCGAVLPAVLLAHAVLGGWVMGGTPHGSDAPPRPVMVARLIAPVPAVTPASLHAAPPAQDQPSRPVRTVPEPPAPQAGVAAITGFKPSRDLDRAAVPRSAPDVSMLEGLHFSGLPMRLRLYVDATGKVADVVVLQAVDDDDVLDRVRHMFLSTAFIAGRLHGEDVASYKDLELVLTSPG